jgi:isoamylase
MEAAARSRPAPLGPTVTREGVSFSVYSKRATAMELLLFDGPDDRAPARVLRLDADRNRTGHYWHCFVPGLRSGQIYAYRVHGPFDPKRGHRFDPHKVLLDPYGRAVAVPEAYERAAGIRPGRNDPYAMKSVVADLSRYDWEGDAPLHRPFAQTVIYECHVRGMTRHPSSGVPAHRRGTYAGLVDKIPYLVDLGITAVELLPVFQFDPQDAPDGLSNYWGYSPVSFFAPHVAYSSKRTPLGPLDEFRDLVKAMHRAGIEVILDVVYNHTAEGNEWGPVQSLKGFDNRAYYTLTDGGRHYANYSGTGNTLNADRSVTRRLIVDSLRFWAQEMHVDGFRFDLASILGRDSEGEPVPNPPLIWDIDTEPALAGTKLIAEAWDAAGLYQVGSFGGYFWKEWNGRSATTSAPSCGATRG